MSQAASASFQRTAIDAGGKKQIKKQIKIQILVEPPKCHGLNTVVMSSSAYSNADSRFWSGSHLKVRFLVRLNTRMIHFCNCLLGPLCGTKTLKRSHVIANIFWFICNRQKTNPLQSWGIVHLFNVGADLDCASADDKAAHMNGWEAYGHDVLIHAYCGRRFQIRQSHQTRQALMTPYHNLIAFATQARLV